MSIPSGIDIKADSKVTDSEATISDKIPKSGGSEVGYQYFPKIKSLTETSSKIGIPSMKRNTIIMKSITIEADATTKKSVCIVRSVIRRLLNISFPYYYALKVPKVNPAEPSIRKEWITLAALDFLVPMLQRGNEKQRSEVGKTTTLNRKPYR